MTFIIILIALIFIFAITLIAFMMISLLVDIKHDEIIISYLISLAWASVMVLIIYIAVYYLR